MAALLGWEDAHAGWTQIVDGVPAGKWNARAPGLPHTLWELLEHIRLAQRDILEFCRDSGYSQPDWPDDYWPDPATPATEDAVRQSKADYLEDRGSLTRLALDESIDLFASIPHGSGQTYLRELLLVADHTSYHLGQMIAVRQALGIWK
jgi:uncharacterized damage-inducible protein DinB